MFKSGSVRNVSVSSMCHLIVLALRFCTTERDTYSQSTSFTSFVCVKSIAAVNGELGSAAHFDFTEHHFTAAEATACICAE